jgi:eukaryotic-like serine/threonine-protein kinase
MRTSRATRPGDPASVVGSCAQCGVPLHLGDRFCGGCGAVAPEAAEAELLEDLRQATLGKYDVFGVLGRGGMGVVYLAHDLRLDRKVAIKVLPPMLLMGEGMVERFRREAKIAASLRHRHITPIFGLEESTRLLFFVMEFVEGRTLSAILGDHGALKADVARAVLVDVADALEYAHRRGVVHRDVKPGNVIVDTEGMCVVTDFGVAKARGGSMLTSAGVAVGSPLYMSPEQWSGVATAQSDQFSLGAMAYEMVTGCTAFAGETTEEVMRRVLDTTPPALQDVAPACPAALAQTVMRMLERDPANRWPSLAAAIAALGTGLTPRDDPVRTRLAELAKGGHEVRTLPRTPRSPVPRTESRARAGPRLVVWGAVAMPVAAGLAVALYLITRAEVAPPPASVAAPSQPAGTVEPPRPAPPPPAARTRPPRIARPPGAMPAAPAAPPTPAVLEWIVNPWAHVTIDDASRGDRKSGVDTLASGAPHRLRFERPGFVSVDTTVRLRPGERRPLAIELRRRSP